MSIDIFVQRDNGDKRGDDIVDPLIGSVPVAIQRGRNELDDRAGGMQQVEAETVYRDGVRLGQVAQFYDTVPWYGKVTGITHRYNGVELTSTLQVKRPTNFYVG